jgi:hypothetical protein
MVNRSGIAGGSNFEKEEPPESGGGSNFGRQLSHQNAEFGVMRQQPC